MQFGGIEIAAIGFALVIFGPLLLRFFLRLVLARLIFLGIAGLGAAYGAGLLQFAGAVP